MMWTGGIVMPIHDWTRVPGGIFHAFHLAWIAEIWKALNADILPSDYYAQSEQIALPLGLDMLTLRATDAETNWAPDVPATGGVALTTAPPRARWTSAIEVADYVLKRRTLVIRHSSGDRVVALIEIVSPGNKSSRHALRSFVDKAVEALYRGYHLLVIDLFPPGLRDPNGIPGEIWSEIGVEPFALPPNEPLTLSAYSAGPVKRAYVEPTAVGQTLIDRPLFLEPEEYVDVPLEATYMGAYRGVPQRWKQVLE
jgi:hypothetical protein